MVREPIPESMREVARISARAIKHQVDPDFTDRTARRPSVKVSTQALFLQIAPRRNGARPAHQADYMTVGLAHPDAIAATQPMGEGASFHHRRSTRQK
jgi:hypothetical protein